MALPSPVLGGPGDCRSELSELVHVLGGEEARSKAGQHKQRILLKRARHEFIENVKGMVERKIFEGNVVEAYNEFSKLCVFNLEKNHALHFEDPTDPTNDAEYIPSMLECCR